MSEVGYPPIVQVADEESNVAAMDTTAVEPEVNQGAYQNTYQSVGDTPPEYPIQPPPVVAPAGSGLPAWVWVMVGVLLANVLNKVMEFVDPRALSAVDHLFVSDGVEPGQKDQYSS